ncbi:hypothetical protein AADW59_00825 [Candidatus Hodgkinia cicadicola]
MSVVKCISSTRAGALTCHSAGVYTVLPYGKLVFNRLEHAFKIAMNKLAVKEVLMPCATRANMFVNRLKLHPEMFITTTNNMVLAPTAEDIVLTLPNALSLGKLYQIQLKFRNEARASARLIRGYEFIMKDCYMLFKRRRELLAEFKRALVEYSATFLKLEQHCVFAISDGSDLGAKHSFEFAAPSTLGTAYYVHAHSLVANSAHYLSFTCEYVIRHKIVISRKYLSLTGLELAHTFLFERVADAWFASLGVGISRLLGHVLSLRKRSFKLLSTCDAVVLNVARIATKFARYVYCVLRCTMLNCVMFEVNLHVGKLLGMLKRLPPKLITFVNVPLNRFLLRFECWLYTVRAVSLQRTLALAHAIR